MSQSPDSGSGAAKGSASASGQPGLRRALSLWDLVFYGILYIQPTAPMAPFGVVAQEARGHVVTTILIAMVAMLFTAISYGRMARVYPSAGSAYTYVGREIHPTLGFITGWAMVMDYVINPIICIIWCAKATVNLVPEVPFPAWVVLFVLLCTILNLRGIRTTARAGEVLVIVMCLVVVYFFIAAIRYLFQVPPASFTQPFYDSSTFSVGAVSTGASIAVLTYIGFDGIATLSEEAHNPRRNILLAMVLTCAITGLLASAEVYTAQLVWPDYTSFPDADTAFVHVAARAGGPILFWLLSLTLLVANMGSSLGAQLAAARLLYAMGRDNNLPKSFFGAIESRRRIPRNNVLLTGALTLAGAFLVSFQFGVELLNFGAFIGFMGVNAAAFLRCFVRDRQRTISAFVPPVVGFTVCLYIWFSLGTTAQIAGGVWLLIGILYAACRSRGFRVPLVFSEPPPDQ